MAVEESTYMDDSMPSVLTEKDGEELVRQLTSLWAEAGMNARKWLSNAPEVLKLIPQEDRVQQLDLDAPDLPSIKTLGLLLDANSDCFSFKFNQLDDSVAITKRFFLRKLASIFDPLGLLAPFVVRAKILFQELWLQGYDWDDHLAADIHHEAVKWFAELPELVNVQVPRCLRLSAAEDKSRHSGPCIRRRFGKGLWCSCVHPPRVQQWACHLPVSGIQATSFSASHTEHA